MQASGILSQSFSTSRMMQIVILALIPGCLTFGYYFGSGVLINVIASGLTALVFEVLVLILRGKEVKPVIKDGSALVTGLLIGLALPPLLPLWMILIANFFAIVIAKQLYGGLGHNIFNPAMVGYAVLIVSFPIAMSSWTSTDLQPDAYTSATPLDQFKFRGALTVDELFESSSTFGRVSGVAWERINLAFLLGGLMLVYLRIVSFRAPLAMLLSLSVLSLFFYQGGSSASLGSPLFHLFSGATMLTAFFIVTDPVTSPDSETGQIIFGAGVGLLIFLIRSMGAFPDGAAFAILLMNACSPLIDQVILRLNR